MIDLLDDSKETEIIMEEGMKFEDNTKSKIKAMLKSLKENGKKENKETK